MPTVFDVRRAQLLAVVLALGLIVAGFGAFGHGSAQTSGDEQADGNATPEAALPTIPLETTVGEGDWPVAQGDLQGTRNALNSSIDSGNLGDLDVAWRFDLEAAGFFGTVTANPIVVGDTVFIQDMQSNVFAIDRWSGLLKWKTEFGIGSIGPNGVAVGYGLVYAGLSDTGEVVALDIATGTEVWRQRIGSPPGEGIDMAPMVYDGMVYISTVPGTGVGPTFYQNGDRGVLYVLDALTGEVAWWFDTTDGGFGVPRLAGGGGLWYPPSFDDDGNIYFGVGNPSPWPLTEDCPNAECRPGDNLYTSAMVSLDAHSGAVRWYYQDRPHDLLDLDFQNTPVLATVTIDGADTEIAVGSGKTGNVVAVDANSGEVIWSLPVGKHQNDENAPLPDDPIEIFPGAYGGVETPIGFANGVVFATWVDLAQYQGATGPDPDRSANFADAEGGILAINAADGSVIWEVPLPTFVLGGVTIANDVVFTAGLDGLVRGFDAATGDELWSWEADLGINAPLAIADDTIFVAAGFVKMPQVGATPAATPAAAADPGTPQLVAIRVGGASAATPVPSEATAAPEASSPEAVNGNGGTGEVEGADVTVSMIDIAFDPKEITIPAETDTVVGLTNDGVAIHNFNIPELNIASGDYQAGQSGSVTVNAQAGDYTYFCSIPGHREAGMVGTLHVE
ncbi:MAG: PQQ-binding-like beta-propeller repeat protein [Thermomicrobiales bacterium]|nr:PQQ-binding-like beta-propeller repeat protein [Thermomicrobiales bacterium]